MKTILLTVIILIFFTGCTTTGSKNLPVSEKVQNFIGPPSFLKDKTIAVYIIYNSAKITGGHHEGIMQVRQPWIFGLSKDQKEILYGNACEFTSNAFSSELARQGLLVFSLNDWNEKQIKKYDYILTLKIDKILLNTFGRGTFEGFGSAGDYWESKVSFSEIKLESTSKDKILFIEKMETYAKLKPCPAKLDWSFLTIINKSLQNSIKTEGIENTKCAAKAISISNSYFKNWEATYHMDGYLITPFELASRKAACEILKKVK